MSKKSQNRTDTKVNRGRRNAPTVASLKSSYRLLPLRFDLKICLVVAAAVLAVYADVWRFGLVNYDDQVYIVHSPYVLNGLTWDGIIWSFTTPYFSNWHPLTTLSYLLDAQIYGTHYGGYHLTNLLLHLSNSLLLFGFLYALTDARWCSGLTAILFGVHPLHVESVAWVSERKDVLSMFFFILTLCAYVHYVRKPSPRRYLVMVVLFVAGLMSKSMLVTLPFILLLLDYWPLDRLESLRLANDSINPETGREKKTLLMLFREKLPIFTLAAFSSVLTYVVQENSGAVMGIETLPFNSRLANVAISYLAYIKKLFWPARLLPFYPLSESIPAWKIILSSFILLGITVVAILLRKRKKYFIVGWLWFLGMLVPVIGLVQVGAQSMADRYTYIPAIGFFIFIVWGVYELTRVFHGEVLLPCLAGILIIPSTLAAHRQVSYWKDSFALWTHALNVTEANYIAHANLGQILAEKGNNDEAIEHYKEALRLKPDYAAAHNDWGAALETEGNLDGAAAHYAEALRLDPQFAQVHYNWGRLLANQGHTEEAIAHYREAVRLQPDYATAHTNLGAALANAGKTDEALAEYHEALRLDPRLAEAHYNLGSALEKRGMLDQAIAQYSQALRLKPRYPEARNNLGAALARKGQLQAGLRELSEAVRVKPTYAEAHNNIGVVLVHLKRYDEATREFSEAVRLDPAFTAARENLNEMLRRGQMQVLQPSTSTVVNHR